MIKSACVISSCNEDNITRGESWNPRSSGRCVCVVCTQRGWAAAHGFVSCYDRAQCGLAHNTSKTIDVFKTTKNRIRETAANSDLYRNFGNHLWLLLHVKCTFDRAAYEEGAENPRIESSCFSWQTGILCMEKSPVYCWHEATYMPIDGTLRFSMWQQSIHPVMRGGPLSGVVSATVSAMDLTHRLVWHHCRQGTTVQRVACLHWTA